MVYTLDLAKRLNVELNRNPKAVHKIFLEQHHLKTINNMVKYYENQWKLIIIFEDKELTRIKRFDIFNEDTETHVVTSNVNCWFAWNG